MKKNELTDLFTFLTRTLPENVKKQVLVPSGRGGVAAARDYTAACALLSEVVKVKGEDFDMSEVQSKDQLLSYLHPATKFRLRSYTPCLAARYDELKEKEQKACFEDSNWVATEKQNGCRGWLICTPDGQTHLYSRNYSDRDCSLLEYWQNIAQTVNPHDDIYAIDVEIKFEPGADIRPELEKLGLATDSPLEAMVALLHTYPEEAVKIQNKFKEIYGTDLIVFRLIAPLYFQGRNYVNRTLGEGMDVYDAVVARGQELGINVKPIIRCNGNRAEKENFLNSILDAGGEGVVFHYRKGMYCTSENRSKTAFIKLKRSVAATTGKAGMGDQIDGYVSGFKMGSNGTSNEGLISALEFSIYVLNADGSTRKHLIAVCPNIDLATKQAITWMNADGCYPQEWVDSKGQSHWVSLNPDYNELVGELDGQALSAVSQRLEHPRLLRWRVERDPNSCIYTKEWLDSQTTGVGIKYN